jgi:short-subunit dehydrogenase
VALGLKVAIAGRDVQAMQHVAEETDAVCIAGDLREPGCPRRTVEEAVSALGGLDVVISNAGIGWAGSFESMTESEIDALFDVNLRAAAHIAHAAIPHLRASHGRLVFVGSIAGLLGVPSEAWYSSTKAGLRCLAESLREELRPIGVSVSIISPGVVDTPYFERRNVPYDRHRPQMMSAETAASAIVDMVARGRDEVIIPSWLSIPVRVKLNLPGLYRVLAARFG